MNKALLFYALFFSSMTFASQICTRSQTDLKSILLTESNRIDFKNDGGLFNSGVCWWHARLQRSSAYLTQYEPEKNPPSILELQKILHSLRIMNQVVFIPGYADFQTFSRDYKKELQDMLNDWQKKDGFFNFEWIRGISGESSLNPAQMQLRMNNIFKYYNNSPTPLWIMAQIKGIDSHSLLLVDMKKIESGFELMVIDSNHPTKNVLIEYHEGDTFLQATGEKYSFVPYAGFQNDFKKISNAISRECENLSDVISLENLENGQVEVSD
jgi:hypothetical protein